MTFTANYSERIDFLRQAIREADHIIIGAGSGLSTAAGIDYGGEEFRCEFAPWIERYGFTDLYTSSFYPFETQEEYWAYWAKHIWFSRYRTGATGLYKMLLWRDYRWFQPASGMPKTLIDNREWVTKVLPLIDDCRIPTEMIPTMPDGSPAAMNLRVDDTFVEDFRWHRQARRYTDFVQQASQGKLLLLEFGIGYNTPDIIRLPFEQMAQRFPHTTLIRFNRDNPEPYIEDLPRFAAFTEDIATSINIL